MEFSQIVSHGGLSARGTATRHGQQWTPRVGTAATATVLADADLAHSFRVTFPAASGRVTLEDIRGGMGTGGPAGSMDTIVVTGVTGADEASVNGTYTRSATLYNHAPQWVNGSAVIRLSTGGFWSILLSGVAQFTATRRCISPVLATDFYADAGAAGTGGTVDVAIGDSGTDPTVTVDLLSGGIDPEGFALPALAGLRGVELVVTAGSGMVALNEEGLEPVPLPLGGRAHIALPADIPAGLMPWLHFFSSEAGTVVQITVAGVAA